MTEAQKKARTKAAWSPAARRKRKITIAKRRKMAKNLAKKFPLRSLIENTINRKHLRRVSNVETDLGVNLAKFQPAETNELPQQFLISQIEELREERRTFEHNFYDAIMWMVRR